MHRRRLGLAGGARIGPGGRLRSSDPLPGFGAAWNLTEPISSSGHPFSLSPEEREKYRPRYEQLWRFDIPSEGPGTL